MISCFSRNHRPFLPILPTQDPTLPFSCLFILYAADDGPGHTLYAIKGRHGLDAENIAGSRDEFLEITGIVAPEKARAWHIRIPCRARNVINILRIRSFFTIVDNRLCKRLITDRHQCCQHRHRCRTDIDPPGIAKSTISGTGHAVYADKGKSSRSALHAVKKRRCYAVDQGKVAQMEHWTISSKIGRVKVLVVIRLGPGQPGDRIVIARIQPVLYGTDDGPGVNRLIRPMSLIIPGV